VIFDSWPLMNICQTEKRCIITCEIAGMDEDDFQVSIEGNDLRIAGHRPDPGIAEKVLYHRYEIKHGRFGRNYWVPNVDSSGERAYYQDGYLKIIVPLGEKAPIIWDPSNFYSNVRRVSKKLDSLFVGFGMESEWPPANVYETGRAQVILCEVAGMKDEDFGIETEGGRMIISGIRQEPCPGGRVTYHCLEIPSGPFRREFPLLPGVDPDRAEAVYRDGFLTVTIPKIPSKNRS
jgi:HSP20 family molecular chaperone IbpA